jgi:hypothetical protein
VYSADLTRPIQQGDLFISSGITRTAITTTHHTPPAWHTFSTPIGTITPPGADTPGLTALGGRALVMVVSHDCHLDTEANRRARTLVRDHGLDEDTAFAIAEADDTLDRHVIVSPVVMLDAVLDPDDTDNRALMRRGRLLGHLPLDDHEPLGIAGMVVDLGYRATVDRLSLDRRLVSLTDPARIRLRYALARMDSLRTPDIGHELDLALGRRIVDVRRPDRRRDTVSLVLDDGSVLDLMPRPGDTPLDGPRRQKPPGTSS